MKDFMDPLVKFAEDCVEVFFQEIEARGFTIEDVKFTHNTQDDRPLELQAAIEISLRKMAAFALQQFEERDLAKTLKTKN